LYCLFLVLSAAAAAGVQMQAAQQLQKSGVSQFMLEDMDFGRRLALEKEIRAAGGAQADFEAWGAGGGGGWAGGGFKHRLRFFWGGTASTSPLCS
jgi:hypothetical protein